MKKLLFLILCFVSYGITAQEKSTYDEKLAKTLKADEYGMKSYVFCILKTGSNTTATKEERQKYFEGHMANIKRLAEEKKLVIAGPFGENNKNYRGIFIFNVETLEEAQQLVDTDPAVQAKLLEAELTPWYSSATLQMVNELHKKVAKTQF